MSRQRQSSGVPTSKACGRSCIEFLLEVDRRPGDEGRPEDEHRGDEDEDGEARAVADLHARMSIADGPRACQTALA